jgi:glutamyl-tRNA synthetase
MLAGYLCRDIKFETNYNMNKIRLRLAPSPTGFLHIGNLRTALFGYLLAKSMDGQFILRIEDTDEKREVAGAAESLVKVLNWIGIGFDEGPHLGGAYGPYIQSERKEIYHKYIEELLARDGAYHCFCSADDLTKMREEQQAEKLPPRYDRRCRNLSKEEVAKRIAAGETYIIRQKLPLTGEVIVHDELRGDISFQCADLEDHALIKSNGVPTYQFASVVDDHLMEISHVTRGDEWLPSFPKNILLYRAFGWEVPVFIHLPLILNKTGGKLSKRQGDVFVEQYRERGYLPEALINFCALLGWHPKHDKEILSLTELEQEFAINGMGASPAVFDEEKLDYYNAWYIRQKTDQELLDLTREYLPAGETEDYLLKVITTVKDRLKHLPEIKELANFYFGESLDYDVSLLIWKSVPASEIKNNLTELLARLEMEEWDIELESRVVAWLKESDKKLGDYLWPLRVALTGQKASPGPFEVALVLGKERAIARIKQAISKL